MTVQGSPLIWIVGLVLSPWLFGATKALQPKLLRLLVRACLLGMALGIAVIPGGQGLVVAPAGQLFYQGIQALASTGMGTADLGVTLLFAPLNMAAAAIAMSLWRPRVSYTAENTASKHLFEPLRK